MSDNEQRYAFGANQIDGVGCPVMQATGDTPEGTDLDIAEWYDEQMYLKRDGEEGAVPRDVARDAWDDMLDTVRQHAREATTPRETEHFETLLARGEEIRNKAF